MLQSMRSQRVRHDWTAATRISTAIGAGWLISFLLLLLQLDVFPLWTMHLSLGKQTSPGLPPPPNPDPCYLAGEGSGTPLQYSCLENPLDGGAWCAAVHGVPKSRTRLSDFTFTFHCHALEKEMATHSSVLAWRIPGTGEPGGLLSMGSLRVGHDWATSLSLFTFMHWRRKWQPTPVFLPGKFHGWRSLVGYSPWTRKESDMTQRLHFLSFFHSKNIGVGCHSLLQWTMSYKNSSLWSIHLWWPCKGLSHSSLSYASPFAMIRLGSTKGIKQLTNT